MRQVIIAVSNKELAAKLKAISEQSGSPVRAVCGSGAQALQTATDHPDGGVLLSTMRLPDMSVQQLIEMLPDTYDCLLLVTAEQHGFISGHGIYKLVEPITALMLADWIRQLLLYRQVKAAHEAKIHRPQPGIAATPPRHGRNTEEQKLIEQAKYLLMNRKKLSEQEAHRYLQKRSMQSGLRLVDLARQIIE